MSGFVLQSSVDAHLRGVSSPMGLMARGGDVCLGKEAVLTSGARKWDPNWGKN